MACLFLRMMQNLHYMTADVNEECPSLMRNLLILRSLFTGGVNIFVDVSKSCLNCFILLEF